MLDDVTPCHSASISPELVALIKGSHAPVQSAPAQGPDRDPAPPPAHPDWRPVALRRDGARPLRAEALLAWTWEDRPIVTFAGAPVAINRCLSIYIRRNQDVLVHLRHLPPEGYPARPVYRVFQPQTAQDLSESLRANGPELCFDVSAQRAVCPTEDLPAPFVPSVPI